MPRPTSPASSAVPFNANGDPKDLRWLELEESGSPYGFAPAWWGPLLTGPQLRVMLAIASLVDRNTCLVTRRPATIADLSKVARTHVSAILVELSKAGVMLEDAGKVRGKPRSYRVKFKPPKVAAVLPFTESTAGVHSTSTVKKAYAGSNKKVRYTYSHPVPSRVPSLKPKESTQEIFAEDLDEAVGLREASTAS